MSKQLLAEDSEAHLTARLIQSDARQLLQDEISQAQGRLLEANERRAEEVRKAGEERAKHVVDVVRKSIRQSFFATHWVARRASTKFLALFTGDPPGVEEAESPRPKAMV